MKCAVTTLGVVGFAGGVGAFALGNIGYAGTLCVLFVGHALRHRGDDSTSILPKKTVNGVWWDDATSGTAMEFWVQSVQKWFLENGEKVAMVFLGSEEQAGEYVLVSNLGSIVARLLFQPLEEMALATFGQLQALAADGAVDAGEKKRSRQTMLQAFSVLFRLLFLLGLVFASFGPAYSHLLLHLLYGTAWSATAAPRVLAWYCFYIMVMAVNGLCEAFVQGVATKGELRSYNYWMVIFSVFFLCAVVVLMPYGAVGIVGANILKMVSRIAVCTVAYIFPAFDGGASQTLSALLPGPDVLGAFVLAAAATQASSVLVYQRVGDNIVWVSAVQHVVIGAGCLLAVLGLAWKRHGRQLIRDVKELKGR